MVYREAFLDVSPSVCGFCSTMRIYDQYFTELFPSNCRRNPFISRLKQLRLNVGRVQPGALHPTDVRNPVARRGSFAIAAYLTRGLVGNYLLWNIV